MMRAIKSERRGKMKGLRSMRLQETGRERARQVSHSSLVLFGSSFASSFSNFFWFVFFSSCSARPGFNADDDAQRARCEFIAASIFEMPEMGASRVELPRRPKPRRAVPPSLGGDALVLLHLLRLGSRAGARDDSTLLDGLPFFCMTLSRTLNAAACSCRLAALPDSLHFFLLASERARRGFQSVRNALPPRTLLHVAFDSSRTCIPLQDFYLLVRCEEGTDRRTSLCVLRTLRVSGKIVVSCCWQLGACCFCQVCRV